MFIIAITWKLLVLCSTFEFQQLFALSAFHVATSCCYSRSNTEEKVELVFCLVHAAHTNGSSRGCCLSWTISPLFNYVFMALLFTPEEIGNT